MLCPQTMPCNDAGLPLSPLVNAEGPRGPTSFLPGSVVSLRIFFKRKKSTLRPTSWWEYLYIGGTDLSQGKAFGSCLLCSKAEGALC